ncbi:Bifunctional delta 6-fatty acyl acetylenase/desaturase [Gracilariopsis chorda]|uniref:Bifunctional delta 6-fatty acyl acetylenase/desaturase n=1 Tax=Gracilariopsis chorda TaxID=448386 RepID=A0A2V3IZJ7_9FLOR|nr:Bifunctional delta 6-fatty acyl acetylenase/desaturase [Gracilariopsis chorda]|eukprot:PXF47473.1 Bifunctional delta 6-fatty acyl acetylenase/desaturase [Gracilariopsis chorda]
MCKLDSRSQIVKGSAFAGDSEPSSASSRLISWSELSRHNTVKDAWIAIKGKVYDVTEFAKRHPGGDIIFTAAGTDATDVYAGFHASTDAWRLLPPLCVGVINQASEKRLDGVDASYVRDVLEMRKQVQALRLFDSSKLFYAYKILSNVSICALSATIALAFPSSSFACFVAALLMALFWQQCGWLAHDFLHHQVFVNRGINNLFGLLIGNIFQGFSVSWWKNKHNHHHAVPNVTDAPSGGDPDIATMPILFWSEKLVEGEDLDKLPRWMLRNQATLYWPILCMARTSWVMQSLLYQATAPNPHVTSYILYVLEVLGLATHHVLFLLLVKKIAITGSIANALLFMFASQALGGVLLGVVFAVGHNAMDVLTIDELRAVDFIRLQVRTTRNVSPHWFTDWFTGGLNYQIEHHIFPTVPRHHLPKLAKILRAFCAKHEIPYASETLIEGNKAVCNILRVVSKVA